MPSKYDEAYNRHLLRTREHKRMKSDKMANALGVRYCASRTHYVELAKITKRRGGKSGPWICDDCLARRAEHMNKSKSIISELEG